MGGALCSHMAVTSNGHSADSTERIPAARSSQQEQEAPAAAAEPAPRKPRRFVRRTVKTVGVLAVVLAFLALGDRWAVLYAEDMAEQKVQEALKLEAQPEVHIDSFPFLGRLALGGVDKAEVSVPHVPAGRVSVAKVKGTVDDLEILGDLPTSVKGANLSRVHGEVFLSFDDLDREVGASQVHFTPGPKKNTVLAKGELPVAGKKATVRARAQLQRTGDHQLAMSVADTRLVVPGLLTYTPGKGGGLQLAAPAAEKMDAEQVEQTTGKRPRPDELLKGRAVDALADHPELLRPAGIDPALIKGLQKVREPKVAKPMEFSAQLPQDMPGDLRLSGIAVTQDGVRAQLTGKNVPVGKDM